MAPRLYTIQTPSNPFLQVLYLLVGGLLLIGAVLMGAVILAIAFGVALVVGLIVYVRVWWLGRKLRRSRGSKPERPDGKSGSEDVLEVEYTVVDERDDRRDRS